MGGRRERETEEAPPPGPGAKAAMAVAALVVVSLVAYLAYQAATAPPEGHPEARVLSVEPTPEGELRVEVEVSNNAARGLRTLVVSVPCGNPPPDLTFANVPAQGNRRGVVLCPGDAKNLTAEVSSYIWT